MERIALLCSRPAIVLAAGIVIAIGETVEAQVSDTRVAEVVATSQVESVIGGVAAEMIAGMVALDPTGDTTRVAAAVRTYFTPDSLRNAVVRYMRDHADPAVFDQLHAWVLSDPIRQIETRSDSAARAMTLDQFVRRMQVRPPPADEVAAARRFAEVVKAGEFYVRFVTALQRNALETARAGGMNVPAVPDVTPEQRAAAMQQFTQLAIAMFVQRFEALSPDEENRLIEAYTTPSGAWYVDVYTAAIEAALDDAGRKVIIALQ